HARPLRRAAGECRSAFPFRESETSRAADRRRLDRARRTARDPEAHATGESRSDEVAAAHSGKPEHQVLTERRAVVPASRAGNGSDRSDRSDAAADRGVITAADKTS